MAFEIVDGMTGTKHISSDDLSALNVATIGKADCVLNYGDNFKMTMTNANTATLGTGVGMVGGKRFWNQAATSLTVQSGTQGQKRNDLVVARYAKTSAGIESITPVVIKGTPTTGTAADPEVTANDLKLWRVPLDGISVGEPVKLFEPVASLATIGDSVSQDTGWVELKNTPTWCVSYRKVSRTVYVLCSSSGAQERGGSDVTLGETLPVGCRPKLPNNVSAIHGILSGAWVDLAAADFFIEASGKMTLYSATKTKYWNAFAVFPVNE